MARTDSAVRVVAAPLDRVFASLVDPEALAAWLPPEGMDGRFERFDLRPGGSYRLVPGVRVVQAVDFESDDVPPGITAEDHAEGMASSLANLARFVEG